MLGYHRALQKVSLFQEMYAYRTKYESYESYEYEIRELVPVPRYVQVSTCTNTSLIKDANLFTTPLTSYEVILIIPVAFTTRSCNSS